MGKASFCTNPLHINRIRGWYQRPSITYLNHLPMQNAFSNLQLDIIETDKCVAPPITFVY